MYAYACLCQRRIIFRYESIEIFGIVFRGAVPPVQLVLEKYANFRHHGLAVPSFGRYLDGSEQILLAIGPEYPDG
jgi:hypothetical protein